MRKIRLLVTLLCLFLGIIPALAQSVQIVEEMKQVPYASVMAMYKNEFGSFEKPVMNPSFPYAVIRMHLEGNAPSVRAAKERTTLYMGQQTGVESRVTTYSNQILFLVRAPRHPMIYIDCGDGCERVLLSNMQQLEPNCLYDCKVRFIVEGESPTNDTVFVERGPKFHTLNLHVEPADAKLELFANGELRTWVLENGEISLQLLEGDYDYTLSANRYHTEKGTFHLPLQQSDTTIRMRCMLGWISILSDSTDLQGLTAKMVRSDGEQTISLPCERFMCYPAKYTVTIKDPDYLPYKREILIEENVNVTLSPRLVAKDDIKNQKMLEKNKIEEKIEPIFAANITNNSVFIRGNLPKRNNIIEAGIRYGTVPDVKQSTQIILEDRGVFEKELFDLQPNTEYYAWAYARGRVDTVYSEMVSFRTWLLPPTENGHEYVDMGLSVKWANCNVGASRPEEYGDYFAWGETQPKKEYSWETYRYCNGSASSLNKYNGDRCYAVVDNKMVLEAADDAASANWGGAWRLPTQEEQDELLNNCTWTWTTINGVAGYKVISKINGNSIFLPAARYYLGASLGGEGTGGYWSSSLSVDNSLGAGYLGLTTDNVVRKTNIRINGLSVRPVCP